MVAARRSGRPPRDWKRDLEALWRRWHPQIEAARRNGNTALPDLYFPASDPRWTGEPASFADMFRGLGDQARFALTPYLQLPDGYSTFHAATVQPVGQAAWCSYVDGAEPAIQGFLTPYHLNEFNRQKSASHYDSLFKDARLWTRLAGAAAAHARSRKRERPEVSGEELRNRRMAGPTAVVDFIRFVYTGIAPARQAPFPDELADLGVSLPGEPGDFVRDVPFFPTPQRRAVLHALVRRLAYPERDAGAPQDAAAGGRGSGHGTGVCDLGITCLWSSLQSYGLISACVRILRLYDWLCSRADLVRLPIIYLPIGLDAKTRTKGCVSRRAVVRDLHAKLVIRRAQARGWPPPAELSENPSGEEVRKAIGEIRDELARWPALLVFGIHEVVAEERRVLDEEILDSPLPYILHRLLSEIGLVFEKPRAATGTATQAAQRLRLTDPDIAHATQVLILADAPLTSIAYQPATCFELPACPAERFGDLLETLNARRVRSWRNSTRPELRFLRNVSSSEVEVALVEAMLALAEGSGSNVQRPSAAHILEAVWGDQALAAGDARVEQLTDALVDHLLEMASARRDAAWLATLVHMIALVPGGVRQLTAARVLAAYVTAIGADSDPERPAWCRQEAVLWRPSDGPRKLTEEIEQQVGALKGRAHGLIRGFPSARAPGFDEYQDPHESPEVPPFTFDLADASEQLELLWPLVRRRMALRFTSLCPQKSALLNRLLAEESYRRVLIVHSHGPDRDPHSLVQQRYIILAIDHALASLTFSIAGLLSGHGRAHCRWLIPRLSPVPAYQWIYHKIYLDQLNASQQALSQRHGAELLKRTLLRLFLRSDPRQGLRQLFRLRNMTDIRHFQATAGILQGLVYVATRTSDHALAQEMLRQLEELHGVAATPRGQHLRAQWARATAAGRMSMAKLGLDVAVSAYAALPATFVVEPAEDHPHVCRLFWKALKVLKEASPALNRERILGALIQAMNRNLQAGGPSPDGLRSLKDPWDWRFDDQVKELLGAVPDSAMQCFHDVLARYGELLAFTAERIADTDARAARRQRALLVFRLADALRAGCSSRALRPDAIQLSPRPARNAARTCVALAAWESRRTWEAMRWYQERANHYLALLAGNHTQHRVDQVAVLIIRALARLDGSNVDDPALAMQHLKHAERFLIHYPDRVQLWIRFYLARAQLLCSLARETRRDISEEQREWCAHYCVADIAAAIRLAGIRRGWVERAQRLLRGLPALLRCGCHLCAPVLRHVQGLESQQLHLAPHSVIHTDDAALILDLAKLLTEDS